MKSTYFLTLDDSENVMEFESNDIVELLTMVVNNTSVTTLEECVQVATELYLLFKSEIDEKLKGEK